MSRASAARLRSATRSDGIGPSTSTPGTPCGCSGPGPATTSRKAPPAAAVAASAASMPFFATSRPTKSTRGVSSQPSSRRSASRSPSSGGRKSVVSTPLGSTITGSRGPSASISAPTLRLSTTTASAERTASRPTVEIATLSTRFSSGDSYGTCPTCSVSTSAGPPGRRRRARAHKSADTELM